MSTMQTATVTAEPPAALVADVRKLKAYFPYRICWGAWNPSDVADTMQGADYTKRKFNAQLRKGWVGFIL